MNRLLQKKHSNCYSPEHFRLYCDVLATLATLATFCALVFTANTVHMF